MRRVSCMYVCLFVCMCIACEYYYILLPGVLTNWCLHRAFIHTVGAVAAASHQTSRKVVGEEGAMDMYGLYQVREEKRVESTR